MREPSPIVLDHAALIHKRYGELWQSRRYSRTQAVLIALLEYLEVVVKGGRS